MSKVSAREPSDQGQPAWQQCLADAIAYYESARQEKIGDHIGRCNHPDCDGDTCSRPLTAYEYFTEERGWSDETVTTARLGYAPPTGAIVTHLRRGGYSEETLKATGLFTDDLNPLWQGRFVFPYLDRNEEPIYAISRATGVTVDGVDGSHPEDFLDGKYGYLATSKPYCQARDAPYGLQSLQEGSSAIVAEGIADALSVHDRGVPCVTPAGLGFTNEALQTLVEELDGTGILRFYVIADAERAEPSAFADRDGRRINQESPAIRGARTTTKQLSKRGFDTRFVVLPDWEEDDLDLDQFIKEGWGSLDSLVRSAVPLEQHPAASTKEDSRASSQSTPTSVTGGEASATSGLFDLELTDVADLSEGDRQENPVRHTGDSENYFVVYDEDRAQDFKHDAVYNARTYLLCQNDIRAQLSPNGHLSQEELFEAWRIAKQEGYLPDADPIPAKALTYIARNHDLCAEEAIEGGWKLPEETYREALQVVEDDYDLNPGRSQQYTPEGSGLANRLTGSTQCDSSDASITEADREQPSGEVDEGDSSAEDIRQIARDRCREQITQAIRHDETVLLDALPAMGKSSSVSRAVEQTGQPVTVLTARHDLYDQHAEWCEQRDLSHLTLPAFHRDCRTAAGEYGDEWANRVRELYDRGVKPKTLHLRGHHHLGQPLPCRDDGGCPYHRRWDFDPDEYDVLIGHFTHAFKEEVIDDRVVVFDEAPFEAFVDPLPGQAVSSAVSIYLEQRADPPFADKTAIVEGRGDPEQQEEACDWCRDQGLAPDSGFVLETDNENARAVAPLLVFGLLTAENLGNGWERAVVDDVGDRGDRVLVARQRNNEEETYLLHAPQLESAKGVLGLEGMATPELWQLALDTPLDHREVLNADERRAFLNEGLGLDLIQTTPDAVYPYSGGGSVNVEKDEALIRAVRRREETTPALISTKQAIRQYEQAGLLTHIDESEHYGNLTGSNQFKGQRIGLVIGSQHYGDDYIERWGAFADETIERRPEGKGLELDYGEFGNRVLTHMRENQVLQAVFRFARGETDTTVYVHTAALPTWTPIESSCQVNVWSDGTKSVLQALRQGDADEWTTKEVANSEQVDIGERQVRNNLSTLDEAGVVEKQKIGRGYQWILPDFDEANAATEAGWLDLDG